MVSPPSRLMIEVPSLGKGRPLLNSFVILVSVKISCHASEDLIDLVRGSLRGDMYLDINVKRWWLLHSCGLDRGLTIRRSMACPAGD